MPAVVQYQTPLKAAAALARKQHTAQVRHLAARVGDGEACLVHRRSANRRRLDRRRRCIRELLARHDDEGHWCDGCLRGRAPGDCLTATYCCKDRDGPEPQWTEHTVDRTDAAGIASRRVLAQAAGHKRAASLAGAGDVGKFIIVQARERWSMAETVGARPQRSLLACMDC